MTRQEKAAVIEELKQKFESTTCFYVADSSAMTVEQVNKLRRLFFSNGIEMKVVKNTLARKAMEFASTEKNFSAIFDSLKGPTAILFTDTANLPARIIKEFRKENERPLIKAAFIDSDVFVGDENLEMLSNIKSKDDLLGELLTLLGSPMSNLLSALGSGGQNVMGILKTLEERQ